MLVVCHQWCAIFLHEPQGRGAIGSGVTPVVCHLPAWAPGVGPSGSVVTAVVKPIQGQVLVLVV